MDVSGANADTEEMDEVEVEKGAESKDVNTVDDSGGENC